MGYQVAFSTIRQALASGRIGTPVAARVVVHSLTNDNDVPALAAQVANEICGWLAASPQSLFAHGDVRGGQLTLLLQLARGLSALVSVGTQAGTSPLVESVVFGNQGTLSCEGDWEAFTDPTSGPTPTATSKWLADSFPAAIRRSIQTRQRVAFTERGLVESSGIASTGNGSNAGEEPFPTNLFTRASRRPADPPYGVLLVSGDHTHQPGYADAFRADPRCRLVGICDGLVTPERDALNRRLADRWHLPLFPNYREALARPDVHLVSICAEPERRTEFIVAAAEARRHLYLDKPLCATRAEARQIVAAVREHGVLAHMFSQVGWDPALRVQRLIDSGRLGELRAIHCDLCFAKGHPGTADLTRPRRESAQPDTFELPDAKRELTNIGVYGVILLLWLLRRRVRRVCANTGNFFFAEHQTRGLEDFGQMLLEMDGGLTASVTAARTGWRSHPSGGLHRVYLIGDRGMAVVDAHRPRVEVWSNQEPWSAPPRDPADPMAMWAPLPDSPFAAQPKRDWFVPSAAAWSTDVSRFLDCLRTGQDSDITVELAAAATDVLLRAYQSAAGYGL